MRSISVLFVLLVGCAPAADFDPSLLDLEWVGEFESGRSARSDGVVTLSVAPDVDGNLVGTYTFETLDPFWEGAAAVYTVEGRLEGEELVLESRVEEADALPPRCSWCQGELRLGLSPTGEEVLVGDWVSGGCQSTGSYEFSVWD